MGPLRMTPELAEDVRRLAEATGQTPEEAVAKAVRERLHLVEPTAVQVAPEKPTVEEIMVRIRKINGGRGRTMSDDEALGYDEFGVWTS